MKMILVLALLPVYAGDDPVTVKPLTRAHARVLEDQAIALEGIAEQEKQRDKWIDNLPQHKWTQLKNLGKFTAKFIEVKNNRAIVKREKDGKLFAVPLSNLCKEDRDYIKEQLKIRKGLKVKTK